MTPTEVLAEVTRHGGALVSDGDKLRYRGPRTGLTKELRQSMLEHKDELLTLVASPDNSADETSDYSLAKWRQSPSGEWFQPKHRHHTDLAFPGFQVGRFGHYGRFGRF